MKKIKRKMKNFILKSITAVSVLMWFVFGCLIDSENWHVLLISMMVCLAWILLFIYANEDREGFKR